MERDPLPEERPDRERPEERPEAEHPAPPETDEHPAPGVEHEPEPDAENIVPAKHRPGTL